MKKNLQTLALTMIFAAALAACGTSADIPRAAAEQAEPIKQTGETEQAVKSDGIETSEHSESAESEEKNDLAGNKLQSISDTSLDDSSNTGTNVSDEDEHIPMDVSDCKTFDEVISKLSKDMGYANVKFGNKDTILVASKIISTGEKETVEAVDADIYIKNGDKILYCGYVTSGGSANPLAVSEGYLYAVSHHSTKKYTVTDDGVLAIDEEVTEKFDKAGNVSYHSYSDIHVQDACDNGVVEYDAPLRRLNKEYSDATVIEFTVVK